MHLFPHQVDGMMMQLTDFKNLYCRLGYQKECLLN